MTDEFWSNMRGVRFMIGIPEVPTDAEVSRILLFMVGMEDYPVAYRNKGKEVWHFENVVRWIDEICS